MLKIYELDEKEEWDAVVRSFEQYDVYWLSGYVKAFQIHGDGEPLLFFYEDENTRGINVVMKRDISSDRNFSGKLETNKYFDFATPYGYGGWIIEGENTKKLFDTYEKWCIRNGIISEFVRYSPVLENHNQTEDSYEVVHLGSTIAMDLTSPEIIWANMTSKNRGHIRKAIKSGVKIFTGRNPEIFHSFQDIYNGTMDRDNAGDYYYFESEFYKSILYDLPHNAQIFYAVYEDRIIAASIMLAANGRMNYHLSGSVREYTCLAPTNLLLYEAALWGCANGCKTLYLGGGVGSSEDSLYKFKKAFYRKDNTKKFCIGKKIYCQEIYERLVDLRKTAGDRQFVDDGFFPAYRKWGGLRHYFVAHLTNFENRRAA